MLGKSQHSCQPVVNRLLDDMRLLVEETTFFPFCERLAYPYISIHCSEFHEFPETSRRGVPYKIYGEVITSGCDSTIPLPGLSHAQYIQLLAINT